MAAIGCDLLAWLKNGDRGFQDFRTSQRHNASEPGDLSGSVHKFYDNNSPGGLLPSVFRLLQEVQQKDGISERAAEVLQLMLPSDSQDRPTVYEAYYLMDREIWKRSFVHKVIQDVDALIVGLH